MLKDFNLSIKIIKKKSLQEKMHRDLLSLILPRLFAHGQVKLSQVSAQIFRSFSITKLTDTSKLTDKILNMKSVIDGRVLWENLQILKVYNNLNVTILPPAIAGTLLSLDAGWNSGISDASLVNLRKLQILNVNDNPNVTTLPPALNDTLLKLYAEGKSGIRDASLTNLRKLEILGVANNPNVTTLPAALNDTLLKLNADWDSGISDEAIASLTKLQILNVRDNPNVKRFQSFKKK